MKSLILALMLTLAASAQDVKTEMLQIMDTICKGGTRAEMCFEWDAFEIRSAKLKQDFHTIYSQANLPQKAAFRRAFTASLARSFQARAKGGKFSQIASKSETYRFDLQPDNPSFSTKSTSGNLKVEFRRVAGHLKLVRMSM